MNSYRSKTSVMNLNKIMCYTKCDKIIPVAIAALRESAFPFLGIVIFSFANRNTSS